MLTYFDHEGNPFTLSAKAVKTFENFGKALRPTLVYRGQEMIGTKHWVVCSCGGLAKSIRLPPNVSYECTKCPKKIRMGVW